MKYTKDFKRKLNAIPQSVYDLCNSEIREDRILGYTILFKNYLDTDVMGHVAKNLRGGVHYREDILCPEKELMISRYRYADTIIAPFFLGPLTKYDFPKNWIIIKL